MGKWLVILGLGIAAAGVLIMVGLPLGRLPGDIVIRRGGFTLYLPLATGVVVSVLLTLLMAWLRR